MDGVVPVVMLVAFVAGLFFNSGHKSEVILLPDPDGTVGVVEVSSAAGKTVLNEAGQMTKVTGSAAPSAPVILTKEVIDKKFSAVLAVEPTQPVKFLLYFKQGGAILTAVSEQLLPQIVKAIAERESYAIGIYGHSDRTGSDEYNQRLSLQRSLAVRDLLTDKGVSLQFVDVNSHGEGNPLIPTADGVSEPRNRRVEVIVR